MPIVQVVFWWAVFQVTPLATGLTLLPQKSFHHPRCYFASSIMGDGQHPALPRIVSCLEDVPDSTTTSSTRDETWIRQEQEQQQKQKQKMHWILHWDINETILVGDESGGDTREDCFNKMIAKSAFVQMTNHNHNDKSDYDTTSSMTPTHWWDGSPITDIAAAAAVASNHVPPLYTGWNWPPGCCPYYRTAYKRICKDFIRGHGAIYEPFYRALERRLTRDDPAMFQNILPAFFRTIYQLVHDHPHRDKDRPPTTIVFRTFGTDLSSIAAAMTAFAKGQHPEYPDFVHPEYELDSHRLYRAKWVPRNHPEQDDIIRSNNHDHKEFFQYQLFRHQDNVMVARGDPQVLDLLHDTSNNQHFVFGIQDDYEMWKNHHWEPWAGKPVWQTDHSNHHHILLDDNIHNLPHDGIASVRRPVKGAMSSSGSDAVFESLSGSEIQAMHGRHLIRVPTIEPIIHQDWFLQQIEKVQARVSRSATMQGK